MKKGSGLRSSIIDWEEYEELTLAEKWMYLNEKSREIYKRIERIWIKY